VTEYVAFMEPLPSVKSLNTNTVESHFLQVTTIYQVPGWGSMGMRELLPVGARENWCRGSPGDRLSFSSLSSNALSFSTCDPNYKPLGLYVAGLKVEKGRSFGW